MSKWPDRGDCGRLQAEKNLTRDSQPRSGGRAGATEPAVIGRAGKARTAALACAMARMRNAADVVEGGSIGCGAASPPG